MPLSLRGEHEAELLASRVERSPATPVYASPLRRTTATAEAIARRSGGDLVGEADLREIGCGDADGRTIDEVRDRWPRDWQHNERQDDDDFRWPGGESYREFRARCVAGAARIARRHPGETVVVVTHTGVITQLMNEIHGIPASRWSAFRAGHASITILEWSDRRRRVVCFDDRRHLG